MTAFNEVRKTQRLTDPVHQKNQFTAKQVSKETFGEEILSEKYSGRVTIFLLKNSRKAS